jgi:hypothetical protein
MFIKNEQKSQFKNLGFVSVNLNWYCQSNTGTNAMRKFHETQRVDLCTVDFVLCVLTMAMSVHKV